MTNQLQKKKLELFHVSRYSEGKEAIQEFVPRIPKNRMDGENDSMPRICVSDNLIGCFRAMSNPAYEMFEYAESEYYCPYQGMSYLDILLEKNQSGQMYRIYHFDMETSEVVTPAELHEKGWVPDALKTNEHWITANRKPDRVTYIFLHSVTKGKRTYEFRLSDEQEELETFGVMMPLDDLYFYTDQRNEPLFQQYSKEKGLEIKECLAKERAVLSAKSQEPQTRSTREPEFWGEVEVSEEDLPSFI